MSSSVRVWPVQIFWGFVVGCVITAGLGLSQLVATGLMLGVRIGIDGSIQAIPGPIHPWMVGVIVALYSCLLYTARSLWWAPPLSRVTAGSVVLAAIVLGAASAPVDYYARIGGGTMMRAVPVEVSLSLAAYAFVALVACSLIPIRGSVGVRQPTEADIPEEQ